MLLDHQRRGAQAELWTPDAAFPSLERERLVWQRAGAAAALDIALEELFRPI